MGEQATLYFGMVANTSLSPSTAASHAQLSVPPASGRSDPGLTTHHHGPRGSSRAFPQRWYTYKKTNEDNTFSCSAGTPKPNDPYLSPLSKPFSNLSPLPKLFSIFCKQCSDREEVGRANSVSLVFTHLLPTSFKVANKIYIARLRSLRKLVPRTTCIWHPAEKRNCLCFILIVCSPHHPEDVSLCLP